MTKKLIIILIILTSYSFADEKIDKDIYINSENIFYNKKLSLIELGKDSYVNYQSGSINTDSGVINTEKKTILINDEFYLNYYGDIMKGYYLEGDLNFSSGFAKDVNYIYQKNLKIKSKQLIKNKKMITFKDNFVTPCDLKGIFNCPTWSLKVKKTKYDIEDDYFEHFSSYLQIADRKVLFIPYLGHYGSQAPRKKGLLEPSFQITNINFGRNITTPYYIPIKENTDLKITPTFYYYKQSAFKYFKNEIELNHLLSEGNIQTKINNFYDRRNEGVVNKGYTLTSNGNLNINKNTKANMDITYTSNVSNYKYDNDEKASSIYSNINLNNYNLFKKNDLLISNLSASSTLNSNTSDSSSPYQIPSFKYFNYFNFKNNIILNNELNIDFISRNISKDYLPNRIFRTSLLNKFQKNFFINKNYRLINKLVFHNSSLLVDEGNYNTNIVSGNENNFSTFISSELNKIINISEKNKLKPRIKLILSNKSKDNSLNVNDNSQSLSFDYNNIFEENRYFGSDNKEDGSRIAMGIEQNYKISKVSKFKLNYGRTYDFQKDVNFVNDIKQTSNLSDHLIKIAYDINPENSINYNSRLDKDDYNLKEDSIRYQYSDLKNTFTLDKNLTNKEAFKSSLSDHFLEMKYSRKLTNNSTLSYNNEIDLENSFQFYKQSYQIDFFDDCSILSLVYTKNDYTDGTQLMPNSEISVFYSLKFDSGFTDSKYANSIFE